jgi:hypothetical protein
MVFFGFSIFPIEERQGKNLTAESADLAKKYQEKAPCSAASAVNVFSGTR